MKHELLYTQANALRQKARNADFAIGRLKETANRLQRGEYAGFVGLNPYGVNQHGKPKNHHEVRERTLRVAQGIKMTSIPKLEAFKSEVDVFVSENKDNFPLRVHLKELRERGGFRKIDIVKGSSLSSAAVSTFESGKKAPYDKVVNGYAQVLGIQGEELEKLHERVRREKAERRLHFVKQRVAGESQPEGEGFGERLRFIRESNGFSYKALGELTGLSPEVIYQIEVGDNSRGTYESTLMRLLKSNALPIPNDMLPTWLTEPHNLGEYLRSLRFRAGVTKKEFAEKAGRDQSSIKATESGRRAPTRATIELYEKVLGLKICVPDFSKK